MHAGTKQYTVHTHMHTCTVLSHAPHVCTHAHAHAHTLPSDVLFTLGTDKIN